MISVICGAFNAERTVGNAVKSVLDGTYKDIEFIVCDDGSNDGTAKILDYLQSKDDRVKVILFEKNRGLASALNACIKQAQGEYIARMDADDFSHPDRLEKQLAYLKSHPEAAFVGASARLFDTEIWGKRRYPEEVSKDIIIKYNPFIHPTLLFRREALEKAGGYDESASATRCEDYDLIFRLYAAGLNGRNMQEELIDYYETRESACRHGVKTRLNEFRVRIRGNRAVHGGIKGFLYAFKPLLLLLLPKRIYNGMHNGKWNGRS